MLNQDMNATLLFILGCAGLVTSTISATFGMFGGILLLTVLAEILPIGILIPVHGIAQLFSNGFRVSLLFKNIQWALVIPYFCGALIAAGLGQFILVKIDEQIFYFTVGGFILWAVWGPKNFFKIRVQHQKILFSVLGVVVTLLSLFVGATGPLLATFFLKTEMTKEEIVATKASIQFFTHMAKIWIFVNAGFQIWENSSTIGVLVGSVFLGTYLGKKILMRISEDFFRSVFRWILTILALKMIYSGIQLIA